MKTLRLTLVAIGILCGTGLSPSAEAADAPYRLSDRQLDTITAGSLGVDTTVTVLGVEMIDVWAAVLAAAAAVNANTTTNTNITTSSTTPTSGDGSTKVSESSSVSSSPQ